MRSTLTFEDEMEWEAVPNVTHCHEKKRSIERIREVKELKDKGNG